MQSDPTKWHPVSFATTLSFTGGYQNKSFTIETKEIETHACVTAFVKLEKRAEWLCKAVAGNKANVRDTLKRSQLFAELRDKLTEGSNHPAAVAVPAEQQSAGIDADDPMEALVPLGDDSSIKDNRKRKSRTTVYQPKRAKSSIVTVDMPDKERTRWPGCKATRKVKLLAASTNSTWIAIDDIEWLIHWLHDEMSTGGVTLEEHDAAGDITANCAAPGVHIRWDFNGAWEAIILESDPAVAGDDASTPTKAESFVEKLTPEKWEVVGKIHNYGVAFGEATPKQRKQATFHYLEQHMQQALSKHSPLAA